MKKVIPKPLKIVLSVIGILLMSLGIVFGLALSDPNEPIVIGETNIGVAKIVKAAVIGEPAHLSAEEMSSILTVELAKNTQRKLGGIRFSINSDNTVDVYLPVIYKGVWIGVSANLTVGSNTAEKQIYVIVNSAKVGRLPVSAKWLLKFGKSLVPKGVSVDGNLLSVKSSLLSTCILNDMVGLDIDKITVADQVFMVNVTGNIDRLKTHITQNLKTYIDLWNSLKSAA